MAKRKTSMNGVPDTSLMVRPAAATAIDLGGKRIAVVGGTDGLGRAIAKLAAARGAEVLVVGRTFRDEGHPGLSFLRADLSSMKEAQRVGRSLPAELDVVVLTTGIMAAKTREVTAEGIERDLAVSTLSRLAIVRELAPRLSPRPPGAPEARVFVMGFPGAGNLGDPDDLNAERDYDAMKAHMNTVAGNEALVLDAKERYPGVSFFGLNPGLVKTNVRANYLGEGSLLHRLAELLIGLLMPTPEHYAARVVPLFTAPELSGRSGAMFGKKGQAILPSDGLDEEHVARFVRASEALLARAVEPGRLAS
jgi:NAD(P)-dependent dehydrogenase (short-subunit alcohol dehydrogenase family)